MRKRTPSACVVGKLKPVSKLQLERLASKIDAAKKIFVDAVAAVIAGQGELDRLELAADEAGIALDHVVRLAQIAGWPHDRALGLLPAGAL
jgi:hypothetical protein